MFGRKRALADEAAVLVAIEMMRSNPAYQAAEALRQHTSDGSVGMAKAPPDSPEHKAVLLLISTWESIALMALSLKQKDRIFEVTPVCHMQRELRAAIEVLRESFPSIGANFAALDSEYHAWMAKNKRDARYVTAACNGLHARFG
jgi:hypothetical protein